MHWMTSAPPSKSIRRLPAPTAIAVTLTSATATSSTRWPTTTCRSSCSLTCWPTSTAAISSATIEQLDLAAADYGEAARIAPTDARGWRNRGLVRLFQDDLKGGLADYNKALQYDPADADSWNNRGQAKMRLGDKKGAVADFRKALELNPSLSTAREGLQKLGAAQ